MSTFGALNVIVLLSMVEVNLSVMNVTDLTDEKKACIYAEHKWD